jgi:hypothetical protein
MGAGEVFMHLMSGGPLRIAGVVALLALLTLGVACGKDDKAKSKATASRPDATTLLNQAADRMEQAKSFHFLLDHEKGTSPIVLGLNMTRAEGDVVRPDRLRADVEAAAGGISLKLKLVSIGDQAKITNPFNPSSWQDLPSGTKLSDVFDPAAGTTSALRNVKNPQITGEDTINGVKVWKVEGTVDATALSAIATIAESGYTAKGTAWIGQQTPEVYRIRLEGPLGSKDTQEVVRRLELSKFNDNIIIDPPPSG